MEKTIIKTEQAYFNWLCDIAGVQRDNSSYYSLFQDLFDKPFRYSLDDDENRAMDGIALRATFFYNEGLDETEMAELTERPCNMLELLIGLAQRMDFEMSDPDYVIDCTSMYFWELMDNLGLSGYSDDMYYEIDGSFNVDVVLNTLIDRMYEPDGSGGLFPLRQPSMDQRYVSLFYQMNAYLLEKGLAK